jgi:hypothetical protein
MSKSKNNKSDDVEVRNFVARDMAHKFKSKSFDGRGNRRAKDARKSWKNEAY